MAQAAKDPGMKIMFSPSITNCVVNHVAANYKYDDVVANGKLNDNFTPGPNNADKIFSGCLGSKGHWDPGFKQAMIKSMTGMEPACVTCVINAMEQQFAPSEFAKMGEATPEIMKNCVSCPHMPPTPTH